MNFAAAASSSAQSLSLLTCNGDEYDLMLQWSNNTRSSTWASSTLTILFSDMLNFPKVIFLKQK